MTVTGTDEQQDELIRLLSPTLHIPDQTARPTGAAAEELRLVIMRRTEPHVDPTAGRRGTGWLPRRRLILAAAGLAVAVAGATAFPAITKPDPDGQTIAQPDEGQGVVLVPISYQFTTEAPAAGPHLRALARRIVDAPYDGRTGRYGYHHTKTWGDPMMSVENGRYQVAFAQERKVWSAPDGSGRETTKQLEPEYPDPRSRDYFRRARPPGAPGINGLAPAGPGIGDPAQGGPGVSGLPAGDRPAPPRGAAELRERLDVVHGADGVGKAVATLFQREVLDRPTRAAVLRVLADVPGFVWRGRVTDRAGRAGLAITHDVEGTRTLLVFDPRTGGLLAAEAMRISPMQVSVYTLILVTDRTNRLG
jgi:hypothetical protein